MDNAAKVMSKALLHLVTCILLAIVAAALSGFYFGWPPRLNHVLKGLAEPPAWSTILFVGAACAWVSWRQRKTVTVRRAALWGMESVSECSVRWWAALPWGRMNLCPY
jgi:hypothetical protein